MLVVFLLGDPHLRLVNVVKKKNSFHGAWTAPPYLMKGAETAQDASANPTGELSLGRVAGSREANTRPGIHLDELGVQSFGEAIEERRAAGDDDVAKQMWSDVDVHRP